MDDIKFTRDDADRLIRIEVGLDNLTKNLENLTESVNESTKACITHLKVLDGQVAVNTHFRRLFIKIFKFAAIIIPILISGIALIR